MNAEVGLERKMTRKTSPLARPDARRLEWPAGASVLIRFVPPNRVPTPQREEAFLLRRGI
jgi:hypothetical protein